MAGATDASGEPGGDLASPVDLDLEAWERGDLDLGELERRHPDEDVRALTDIHTRLTGMARGWGEDPGGHWASVESRLRADAGRRRGRFLGRSLLAAALVALLGGATAYAAERQGLDRIWNGFLALAGADFQYIDHEPAGRSGASGAPGVAADEDSPPRGAAPVLTDGWVELEEPPSAESHPGNDDGPPGRDGGGGATGEGSAGSESDAGDDTPVGEEAESSENDVGDDTPAGEETEGSVSPMPAGEPLRAEGEADDPADDPADELPEDDDIEDDDIEDDPAEVEES